MRPVSIPQRPGLGVFRLEDVDELVQKAKKLYDYKGEHNSEKASTHIISADVLVNRLVPEYMRRSKGRDGLYPTNPTSTPQKKKEVVR